MMSQYISRVHLQNVLVSSVGSANNLIVACRSFQVSRIAIAVQTYVLLNQRLQILYFVEEMWRSYK